jgi:hypothetical protein
MDWDMADVYPLTRLDLAPEVRQHRSEALTKVAEFTNLCHSSRCNDIKNANQWPALVILTNVVSVSIRLAANGHGEHVTYRDASLRHLA